MMGGAGVRGARGVKGVRGQGVEGSAAGLEKTIFSSSSHRSVPTAS